MNKLTKKTLPYVYLFFLTIIFLNIFLGYFLVDLSIPFKFGGDILTVYSGAKGLFTHEFLPFQIPQNTFLGAPGSHIPGDYPSFDTNLYYVILKIIYLFCNDFIKGVHIYYFLTYVFVAFSSYYVLKQFRINSVIAGSISLLFAFSPYHIIRGVNHLNLSSYYLIPLMLLTVFWIWSKKPLFFKLSSKKWLFDIKNKKAIITLLILFLSSISSIYYNYFYLYFVIVATVSAYLFRKNIYNVLSSIIMISFNIFCIFMNALPYIIYKIQNGPNTEILIRNFKDAEYYGLKIVQMILPVDNHFLFGWWKDLYNQSNYAINENTSATLGIIGLVGFISALVYFLYIRNHKFNLLDKTSILILSALLLGTTGSFSSFISFTFIPFIRGYNRISIFILFLCLLFFAISFQTVCKNLIKKHSKLFVIIVFIITLIGIRDMIPNNASLLINYNASFEYYKQLKLFIKKVENVNVQGAMIFDMPYIVYPEAGKIGNMQDYEFLKPYMVSDMLHWSYGTIKGRKIDKWFRELSNSNFDFAVNELKKAGFSGILFSKKAFSQEEGDAAIRYLNNYLKKPLFENEEYLYYHF